MTQSFRHWEDVQEGEILPTLRFPITVKTLVLAVCGTRDLMPYHHNSAYSKSLGNRDMFVNTMFEQALFGRFVTDWAGPESDFRATSLQMVGQMVPDDVANIEGRVTRVYREGTDARVHIELTASTELGLAARASATLAMPSRETGPVETVTRLDKPSIQPHPEMPDFAREWLGKTSPKRWGGYPVSAVQILYWCDMVEDANPTYQDEEYATASRHGGVIAPPMGLISWMSPRAGRSGVSADAPDVDDPTRKPWPPREEVALGGPRMVPPGTTDVIATRSTQTYGVPLRPGDRVCATAEVIDCSPLKRTRLGLGYFQTLLDTFYNQNDEIVGTNVFELLRYGVPDEAEASN